MTGTMVFPRPFLVNTFLTSIRSKVSLLPLSPSSQKTLQNKRSTVASSYGPLETPVEPLQKISWPSCQTTRPTGEASPLTVRCFPSSPQVVTLICDRPPPDAGCTFHLCPRGLHLDLVCPNSSSSVSTGCLSRAYIQVARETRCSRGSGQGSLVGKGWRTTRGRVIKTHRKPQEEDRQGSLEPIRIQPPRLFGVSFSHSSSHLH